MHKSKIAKPGFAADCAVASVSCTTGPFSNGSAVPVGLFQSATRGNNPSRMRLAVLTFWILIPLCASRIFEKCELAVELRYKYQMSLDEVKNWVCIAQYESTFNTQAINHSNWDGSKDFGLLQLNNRYWCGDDYGKNVCGIPCEALLDDDLTDDIACAQKIVKDTEQWMKKKNGFVAWVAYVNKCQYQDLDAYIQECMEVIATPPSTETSEPPVQESDTTVSPENDTEKLEPTTPPPRGSGLGQIKPFQPKELAPELSELPTKLSTNEDSEPLESGLSEQPEIKKPIRVLSLDKFIDDTKLVDTRFPLEIPLPSFFHIPLLIRHEVMPLALHPPIASGAADFPVGSYVYNALPLLDRSYRSQPGSSFVLDPFRQITLPKTAAFDFVPPLYQGVNSEQTLFVTHLPDDHAQNHAQLLVLPKNENHPVDLTDLPILPEVNEMEDLDQATYRALFWPFIRFEVNSVPIPTTTTIRIKPFIIPFKPLTVPESKITISKPAAILFG